jgi:hypothetical protein
LLAFGVSTGPSGPSCLVAEGGGPPPASPVVSTLVGPALPMTAIPYQARARRSRRTVVRATRRSGR